jgi:endonuclease/exonuclease/phosphatase family metal-dependent hydrolase
MAVLILFSAADAADASERCQEPCAITLVSLNVKYVGSAESIELWRERRRSVEEVLRSVDPEVVAFQEMETWRGRGHFQQENLQLDDLRDQFPGYGFAAVGDPRLFPSTQPIMYKKDRFELIEQSYFSFSPTPEIAYSRPWKRSWPSFASWARFRDRRTGRLFYLYNVHFDVVNAENRRRSAELVVERVRGRTHLSQPALIAGDFNSPRFFAPVRILKRAGFERISAGGATFHFGSGVNLLPAIDHVFAAGPVNEVSSRVLRARPRGTYPSDHYPVAVTLSLGR